MADFNFNQKILTLNVIILLLISTNVNSLSLKKIKEWNVDNNCDYVECDSKMQTLVTKCSDSNFYIWDINKQKILDTIKSEGRFYRSKLSNDGEILITVRELANKNVIEAWDINNQKRLMIFNLPEKIVSTLDISNDKSKIGFSYYADKNLNILEVNQSKLTSICKHTEAIFFANFIGERIVTYCLKPSIKIWDTTTFNQMNEYVYDNLSGDPSSTISLSDDLVYATLQGGRAPYICVWDLKSDKEIYTTDNYEEHWASEIWYSKKLNSFLYYSQENPSISIYDIDNEDFYKIGNMGNNDIVSISFSKEANCFVLLRETGTVEIWDLEDGQH